MATITLTWRAFSEPRPGCITRPEVSHTFDLDYEHDPADDLDLCEDLFKATNLYGVDIDPSTVYLWDEMQPLPDDRSHTSLSVVFDRGDFVTIDGRTYEVQSFGFKAVTA